ASLSEHAANYRQHPDDQIEHLKASIESQGFYRNVVIARHSTILAGHGVVKAAKALGLEEVPVVRLDIEPDSPAAMKVLVGDNEIAHLVEQDDRKLTEALRELGETDELLGTGYDERMLAALAMVTRPASEIADIDEAVEWADAEMPDYGQSGQRYQLVVTFENQENRERFVQQHDITILRKQERCWSTRWPDSEVRDAKTLLYE
ncbi:MAG: ParB N-terminal domain-containing protein, partial [Dehalococcoidia bacterium]